MKNLRSAIFALESSKSMSHGLRTQVLALARESVGALGFEPRVFFDGPVDTDVLDSKTILEHPVRR